MTNTIEEVPLSKWIESELGKNPDEKRLIIRKTTVAYAAAELLQKSMTTAPLSADKISLDNFVVRTKKLHYVPTSAEDIIGVDMISEKLSLTIVDTSDLGRSSCDVEEDAGRNLVASITSPSPPPGSSALGFEQIKESTVCHLFGILLYQIYSNLDPFLENKLEGNGHTSPHHNENEMTNRGLRLTYSTLRELGSPPNICMLVQNLVECGNLPCPRNTYSSLKEGSDDLHHLLLQPHRLLFTSDTLGNEQLQLRLQKNKLYGRDHEILLMNDAFSRVCVGESVALFVGGFSGSGKTRLVESVMASVVNSSGGYVLTQKFDQVARGGPLLELISAFDRLCVLIQSRTSPQDMQSIVDRLTETFGADLSLLRRLLPQAGGLMPPPSMTFEKQMPGQNGTQMNLQSVCFILQKFIRAVSSKSHPVMIFLDDLQVSKCKMHYLVEQISIDLTKIEFLLDAFPFP